MISIDEALKRLYQFPQKFKDYMKKKEYLQAKFCYYEAIVISQFLEVGEEIETELFGDRQPEEPIEGMFREELVEKAFLECIKRNQAFETMSHEEVNEYYRR